MPTLTEEPRPTTHDASRAPADRPDTRTWLTQRVPEGWTLALLAGWYALILLAQAITPEPANEGVVLAWIGIALTVVFFLGLGITTAGLITRRRWGLVASLGTAGLLVADSIACPMTGHHHFGAFVVIQAVGAVALAGASIAALRRV